MWQCASITHCLKGSSTIWKYNLDAHYCTKHSPALPPAELMITDFELEGLKVLWDNRHTANWVEVRHWKQCRPCFAISEAHSTQLALWTTDLEETNASQDIEDEEDQVQGNTEADHSSTNPNPSSLLPIPSLPTHPSPPSNPSLPIQTSQPTTYPSGHPVHSVHQLATALHKCCDVEITQAEIDDGSTVFCCPKPGCEMVWVSQLEYF